MNRCLSGKAGTLLCRESFSSRGFLREEKVAKPDEEGEYARCAIDRQEQMTYV